MSMIIFFGQNPIAWVRRAGFLVLGVILLGSSAGCTAFQTVCTNQWFDASWVTGNSERPIQDMVTTWTNHVIVTPNSENHGRPLPGLVGRLYFFAEDHTVEAHGHVVVTMKDGAALPPGGQARQLAEWKFDPHSLKQLKRKDALGDGYTLFLPWEDYRPEIRQVELQVCYLPEKGMPRYGNPARITFQTDDAPPPPQETRQITTPMPPRPFLPTDVVSPPVRR